ISFVLFFFFQAEDGIRDSSVTGVQTCALPIYPDVGALHLGVGDLAASIGARSSTIGASPSSYRHVGGPDASYESVPLDLFAYPKIGRASCREKWSLVSMTGVSRTKTSWSRDYI